MTAPTGVEAALRAMVEEIVEERIAEALRAQARPPYLTTDEAAELLRCRRRRIYELVGDGRLRRCGDGRRLLVDRTEVERLAEGR